MDCSCTTCIVVMNEWMKIIYHWMLKLCYHYCVIGFNKIFLLWIFSPPPQWPIDRNYGHIKQNDTTKTILRNQKLPIFLRFLLFYFWHGFPSCACKQQLYVSDFSMDFQIDGNEFFMFYLFVVVVGRCTVFTVQTK